MKSPGLWNVSWGIFGPWKTSIKTLRINIFMETDPYVCFLSRPQETSQYGNINQINCRGIPARAPLLIKPSAEDRTLIKKPCRTVVPLNRGSGRAIAFFFFFLLWCDYIWLLSKQRLTSAGRSDGDSQTYWRSDLQSSNTEADRGNQTEPPWI